MKQNVIINLTRCSSNLSPSQSDFPLGIILRLTIGIICSPFWGPFAVGGSFAILELYQPLDLCIFCVCGASAYKEHLPVIYISHILVWFFLQTAINPLCIHSGGALQDLKESLSWYWYGWLLFYQRFQCWESWRSNSLKIGSAAGNFGHQLLAYRTKRYTCCAVLP